MTSRYSTALALTLLVTPACGGDDDTGDDDDVTTPDAIAATADAPPATPDADPNQPDAPPPPACTQPALSPVSDGTNQPPGGIPPIVISEISIEMNFVEVYNPADTAVALNSLTGYRWCTFPSYANVDASSVVVPAKGYATIPFPISSTNKELVLYEDFNYDSASSVLDYVCWGSGGSIRRGVAIAAGKWDAAACAPDIPSGGSLVRKVGAAGDAAADYETSATPTPETCTTL